MINCARTPIRAILFFITFSILSFIVVIAAPKKPTEFYYRAVITSGEFSQEIQHYQSGELIRQVVKTSEFPPSVTIVRPDLSEIWIYDEGATEYSASTYDPELTPETFVFEIPESASIKRETLGMERLLNYDTVKVRFTDATVPEWELFVWNTPKLGGMSLKKLERVTNNGKVISELLIEVKEIKLESIPKEYFELPEGMTLVKEGLNHDGETETSPELPLIYQPDLM